MRYEHCPVSTVILGFTSVAPAPARVVGDDLSGLQMVRWAVGFAAMAKQHLSVAALAAIAIPGSPADRAGIRPGAGKPVQHVRVAVVELNQKELGPTSSFFLRRDAAIAASHGGECDSFCNWHTDFSLTRSILNASPQSNGSRKLVRPGKARLNSAVPRQRGSRKGRY